MNAQEFDTELSKLINRGIVEGLNQKKMTIDNMVGLLELHKLGLVRFIQDASAPKIRPARFNLPPNGF